jgi:antitoxin CptB
MEAEAARLKRLRWRARRGTRELDALFGGWLDELLDAQDPDLWDWVMGHARPARADWQAIIDDIRTRHRL